MKTILAPVDFSTVSELVAKEAVSLARSLGGRVVLLHVVQIPAVLNEYSAMVDTQEVVAAGEKNAARQLAAIEEELKSQFIQTESVQVVGTPVPVILEQAGAQDADYIVMGSHGHTAFYDLLVGSTTHGVLLRAKCPVVIVPAVKSAGRVRRTKEHLAAV